jgi:predicted HTH transcriptional regulator
VTAVLKLGPRISRNDIIAMRVEQLRTLDTLGRAIEERGDGIRRMFVVRYV